ncbi:hypothetical protein [Streptomyces sp. HPF1205]|uniref:hypothetical protein n=1 Tax=Streptomyces sp. HPF1205 TaxID=2873262 RepID=UPI001CECD82F|nr:hypothetical protein [Streptomyces sp. HPF1205]
MWARQPAAAAAVLATDSLGRIVWAFRVAFPDVPVLSALPVADGPYLAVVEEVTAEAATVRVWAAPGLPAGPGVTVHLRAVQATPA